MGIYGMGPTTGLPMTPTIVITIALISMALEATTLTSGPRNLGIWVTLPPLCEMARLATEVASSS